MSRQALSMVAAHLLVTAVLVQPGSAQTTWYVDDDAPGDSCPGNPDCGDLQEDGSPEHPFDAIQEAIDAAADGDTVLVLDGTYTGEGNRNIFLWGKAVAVRSQSGDPSTCVIDCDTYGSGVGFYAVTGETADTLLDGLTIANGHIGISCVESSPTISNCVFEGNGATHGTIYCKGASPTILGCTITGNSVAEHGGGIYCIDSAPTIESCTIAGNEAGWAGGGIYCLFGDAAIVDCTISGNTAGGAEGGGVCFSHSAGRIVDCTIVGNAAHYGGGICCVDYSDAEIHNCTITDNTACWDGGGVYCGYSSPSILDCVISSNTVEEGRGGGICCDESEPIISGCTISLNTAVMPYSYGGGGYWFHSHPTVSDCVFSYNTAWVGGGVFSEAYSDPTFSGCKFVGNLAQGGGGMANWNHSSPRVTHCTFRDNHAYTGGGVSNSSYSDSLFTNCEFRGNGANYGAGMRNTGSAPRLANCVFVGNATASGRGGGMCNTGDSNPILANCTFSGNEATSSGGAITLTGGTTTLFNCILWDNTPDEIWQYGEATTTVSYSNVQGGWPGEGNIEADPLFADADGPDDDPNTWEDNDYRLGPGSPCIDAGDNPAVPADEADLDGDGDTDERTPLDLGGIRRFGDDPATEDSGVADPNEPALPIVDMGAYEFGIWCDLDGDCDVDGADLQILLQNYASTSGVGYGDGNLDDDSDVDLRDLAELLGMYGATCP